MDADILQTMAATKMPNVLFAQLIDNRFVVAGGWLRWLVENRGEGAHAFNTIDSMISRGEGLPDIDVFGADEATLINAAHYLASKRGVEAIVSENAITVPGGNDPFPFPVQYILRHTYDNPEAVINSFDFTCCQAGFFWESNWREHNIGLTAIVGAEFFEHVAERKLVYTGASGTVSGTLLRVLKYAAKGYGIEAAEYASIIARFVREVDPDSTDLREDQLHERASERLHDYRPYIY